MSFGRNCPLLSSFSYHEHSFNKAVSTSNTQLTNAIEACLRRFGRVSSRLFAAPPPPPPTPAAAAAATTTTARGERGVLLCFDFDFEDDDDNDCLTGVAAGVGTTELAFDDAVSVSNTSVSDSSSCVGAATRGERGERGELGERGERGYA